MTSQSNPALAMISAIAGWPREIHEPTLKALDFIFFLNSRVSMMRFTNG
jgi:hypothetical protein